MKKSIVILCILAVQAFLMAPAFATPINIDNYSFEDPNLGGNGFSHGAMPGWTPLLDGYCGVIRGYNTVSDGYNAAWVQGSNYITQILTTNLQPNSVYTLSLSVGHRLIDGDWATNAEFQLLAGGNVLKDYTLSDSEKAALTLANPYKFFTLTYQSGSSVADNQALEIKLISTGDNPSQTSQPHFDDVTLDVSSGDSTVPEPASLSLLGLGLGGLLFKRRKNIA